MVVHDSRKWMDLLWKDFFKDPSPWFFNLSSKYNSVSPDFRHKTKNQCLWIDDGHNNPSWIHEKRAFLLSLQEENQVRNKNRKKEFDLVALLKDCTKKKDLYGGIKIYTYTHEIVLLRKSPHIASCLIHMFTKCGDFVMAKEVLANFSFSNVVPWNTLISGYVHNGQAQEALECYERMQNKGVSSNAVTFTCILKACGGIGAINKGKQIHYRVLSERLLEKDVMVGSALVDMYVKCGVLAKAQEVLEELPIRNVVTWSSLIAGYVLDGQGQEALNCLEKMQFEGLLPDATTFTCVLQACGNMGNTHKGKQIHEQIVSRQLLEKDIMLGNALVDMYAKCGMLPTAENVLEELTVRNVISWNALISGYVQHGQGHEALNCFERLQSENLSPNAVTFICILKACGIECAVKKGLYIHDLIVGKGLLDNDILLNNALLDMYTKFGLLAKAKLLFEELPIRDIVSWNALIAGCVQQGLNKEALSWFERLQNDILSPNIITFICLLNACGNTRSTEKGKQLHSMIMSMDLLEKDIVLGNALVDMYCKCGLLENAQKVFHDLPNPNIVTWNALISGYARMEQGREGLTCFKEMQREGLNPSLVTFICILKSCISVGAIGKGEQIHEMIKSWSLQERDIILSNALVNMYAKCGLLPKAQNVLEELNVRDVVSWNTLIVGYAQQGQGQEALNCFGLMQHEGISPNKVTFTCILKSCGHSGLLEEAQLLFEHVKRGIGVSLELQHYTHMVVVYSSLGHFDKAMSVMKMMPSCDYSAVWFVLVDSCRKWGNMKLGSWAFEHSLQVNIDCMQPYVLTT